MTEVSVQAAAQMETMVSSLMSMNKCKGTDPQMQAVWEAKASVHERCGDSTAARACHRKALKCKSALAKSTGNSHKAQGLPALR